MSDRARDATARFAEKSAHIVHGARMARWLLKVRTERTTRSINSSELNMIELKPRRPSLRPLKLGLAAGALALFGSAHVLAAAAPNCVHSSGTGRKVTVTNTCSSTQRVKVIFAFARDGACYTYSPGAAVTWTGAVQAQFDGLQSC